MRLFLFFFLSLSFLFPLKTYGQEARTRIEPGLPSEEMVLRETRPMPRDRATLTHMAQAEIIEGRTELRNENYRQAQEHFDAASRYVGALRERSPGRSSMALNRIESEITIYADAARREAVLEDREADNALEVIQDAFYTYHDTIFNVWADLEPWERHGGP